MESERDPVMGSRSAAKLDEEILGGWNTYLAGLAECRESGISKRSSRRSHQAARPGWVSVWNLREIQLWSVTELQSRVTKSCEYGKHTWGFPIFLGVPYFGVLILRILLFKVLYKCPFFSETPNLPGVSKRSSRRSPQSCQV